MIIEATENLVEAGRGSDSMSMDIGNGKEVEAVRAYYVFELKILKELDDLYAKNALAHRQNKPFQECVVKSGDLEVPCYLTSWQYAKDSTKRRYRFVSTQHYLNEIPIRSKEHGLSIVLQPSIAR